MKVNKDLMKNIKGGLRPEQIESGSDECTKSIHFVNAAE